LGLFPFHVFFFSSRRRHTRFDCDWSSDVSSSDLGLSAGRKRAPRPRIPRNYGEGWSKRLWQLLPLALNLAAGGHALRRELLRVRSEERRVGKECRSGGSR